MIRADRELERFMSCALDDETEGSRMAKKAEHEFVHKTEVGGVERVVAEENLHVERTDLGPDVFTFVARGDAIPVGLEELPRHRVDVSDEPATSVVR